MSLLIAAFLLSAADGGAQQPRTLHATHARLVAITRGVELAYIDEIGRAHCAVGIKKTLCLEALKKLAEPKIFLEVKMDECTAMEEEPHQTRVPGQPCESPESYNARNGFEGHDAQ